MFTCKKIRTGSTYLSTHLSANDYYCEQEQVSGIWVGKGAERLGVAGHAIGKDDSAFEALRLNQHPEGSGKLTPRNVTNSIRFFDFQCAPHKSVSIMAVMMEDHRLYEALPRPASGFRVYSGQSTSLRWDGTIRRPVSGFGSSRSDSLTPCDLAATGTESLAEGSRTGFVPTEDHRETRIYDRARTRDSPAIEEDPLAGSASAFVGTGDESMTQIPVMIPRPKPSEPKFNWSSFRLQPVHQECPMTFQCYLPRSSQTAAIGAVFLTAEGDRRFIPDRLLAEAELSEQGRLLRLIYAFCSIEVAGHRLEVLFEDAIVGRLGTILQALPASVPSDQLWVSSIMAIVPAAADSSLDRR